MRWRCCTSSPAGTRDRLGRTLLRRGERLGREGSPLRTALFVSSQLRLGRPVGQLAGELTFLRKSRPAWRAEPFCLDPAVGGVPCYAGAASLTTALCLEALNLARPDRPQRQPRLRANGWEEAIYDNVLETARRRLKALPRTLGRPALAYLASTLAYHRDREIVLLPCWFWRAVCPGEEPPAAFLSRLGMASLFGWMGHTLLDHLADGEGQPEQLPLASLFLRETDGLLAAALPGQAEFARLVRTVLDAQDEAVCWEIQACRAPVKGGRIGLEGLPVPRYGGYGRLAARSLGHGLGACAVLARQGHGPGSPVGKAVLGFFRHYIIARQLNDDAHDWEEDIRSGRVNSVGACLLARYRSNDLERLVGCWRELFWQEVVPKLAERILAEASAARACLGEAVGAEQAASLSGRLLGPVEQGARRTLEQRQWALQFREGFAGQAGPSSDGASA